MVSPPVRPRVLWVGDGRTDSTAVEEASDEFRVEPATPDVAHSRVEANPYGAVVVDDGLGAPLSVVREIRACDDTVPLVLLHSPKEDVFSRASSAGVTAFHPVGDDGADIETLAARLTTLLDTHGGPASRRETSRASVLADLNAVVYRVAEAAFDRETRQEIESFVCQQFADANAYRFAWMGETSEDSTELSVTAQSGASEYVESLDPGIDAPPGERGPTARAVHTDDVHVVNDTQTDDSFTEWRDHAREHGVRSSAAVPVRTASRTFGVLNVYSSRPYAFTDAEQDGLRQLGQLVGNAIDAVERRNRYETIVNHIPNGATALFDAEKRCLTAGGESLQESDMDPSSFVGQPIEEIAVLPERHREWWASTLYDALDGERRTAEVEADDRVARVQVIPVDAGDTVQGAMALTQDITERTRRARQVEAERERLEFLNRLVRHNFLNGLNVVNARCELLEATVDDPNARSHVEHVRNRAADLADLVDDMRTLMDAVVGEAEHSLRRVPLAETLEEEVALASEMHPDARFETDLSGVNANVLADELLGEVFENVLDNAVVHNDADMPEVTVSAGETTVDVSLDESGDNAPVADDGRLGQGDGEHVECPAVTVEIADNGPGLPEEERAGVLETGVSQLSEPGSGFGLYLVKQMVQSYGGRIEIRDNEPTGTVFALTFLTERPERLQ